MNENNYEITFSIIFSKCQYGAAVHSLRFLPTFPYKIDWKAVRQILKDVKLFNKFNSINSYMEFVFRMATHIPQLCVQSNFSIMEEISEKASQNDNYRIYFEEYLLINRVYSEVIDKAIDNYLSNKKMFEFTLYIPEEEIYNSYLGRELDTKKMIERFTETMWEFFTFHSFSGIELNMYFEDGKVLLEFSSEVSVVG